MINYVIFTIGIIVIVISLLIFKKDTVQDSKIDLKKVKEEQRKLMECIEIGEEIIEEINQVGVHVIEKIDKKTMELRNLMKNCEESSLQSIHEDLKQRTLQEEVPIAEPDIKKQNIEPPERSSVDLEPEEDLSEKILKLKASGYTISQIAKELDKGIGEVQLILQLKKR
ncbi:DUF6115 domain-containing protein [Geosporobacter ferrireducens]|uniref:Resolvase HTH domain-containing protein n=1 Tax=Geosporobacter ferrireducens TaxID=1424294 RepID=A0A1D8GBH5_9FIRM|nr:hypothetical protein [Geosporobacter ferrireducens]AOT68252.1 hypothetical protein Gferi_00810 [Geosporobacter ferrireducens]MTI57328.1 hypothetical protein [Geosporobacter ferrireducens]